MPDVFTVFLNKDDDDDAKNQPVNAKWWKDISTICSDDSILMLLK